MCLYVAHTYKRTFTYIRVWVCVRICTYTHEGTRICITSIYVRRSSSITMIRTILNVSKDRNKRAIDVAHLQNPFDRNDRTVVNALYHKSNDGHRLLLLNKNNRPVKCWSNIAGISAIKSVLVSPERFNNLLHDAKPNTIYLNDGEHIKVSSIPNVKVYFNETLPEILKKIEISTPTVVHRDETLPSYDDMLILDPTMTRKSYNAFITKLKRACHT